MQKIDFNADVGEGCGNDGALLKIISSANIACGWHAGNKETMKVAVRLALENNVAIGAHPGYADKENFGRNDMFLSDSKLHELILRQLESLADICAQQSTVLGHVKPHGALYNQLAKNTEMSEVVLQSIAEFDPSLHVVGLAGSQFNHCARDKGFIVRDEGFADRAYEADGSLVSRQEDGAVIVDEKKAVAQVLMMIQQGKIVCKSGELINMPVQTICLHGDNLHAVQFAIKLERELIEKNIVIVS